MSVPQSLTDSITRHATEIQAVAAEIAKERAASSAAAAGGIAAADVPGLVSQIDALTAQLTALIPAPTA